MRNVAGETLWLVWMLLQPAANHANTGTRSSSRKNLRSKLTWAL